jgi:hypothetical protein
MADVMDPGIAAAGNGADPGGPAQRGEGPGPDKELTPIMARQQRLVLFV